MLFSLTTLAACKGGTIAADLTANRTSKTDLLKSTSTVSPTAAMALCLEPEGKSMTAGTRVAIVPCDHASAQQWALNTDTGQVVLGGSMCLDVTEGKNAVGTEVQIWPCFDDNVNQRYDITGGAIHWRATDKCLDITGGLKAGARVKVATCVTAATTQGWTLTATTPTTDGMTGNGNTVPNTTNAGVTGSGAVNSAPVDFGATTLVFDSSMSMESIQAKVNEVYNIQRPNHFGKERYALLFKPGKYNLDIKVGFYTTVAGLGASPDDVQITGSVRVKGEFLPDKNCTQNFWRSVENLSVVPTQDGGALVWAISQGTSFRRVHVRGNMNLFDDNGWSSGGFVADTKVDGTINSGTQQQFLTRNDHMERWTGRNWNMMFVGNQGAPADAWPDPGYTTVAATPVIREKPYLAVNSAGAYVVHYPLLKRSSVGVSWDTPGISHDPELPISSFYIARADKDSADSINAALVKGLHVIFSAGVYDLDKSLQVTFPNTILYGMGIATLHAAQGTPVITVADVDGVSVSGITVDAGLNESPSLLVLGQAGANKDHSLNPTVVHDLTCRVGGASAISKTRSCVTVNSRDVILDNTWLWRADHGYGAGWNSNPSANGIIVNGSNVTAYALFSEHFQGYQTLWNGENGATYMYQSEFPYDPPNQASWQRGGSNGYPSYKVADTVTKHISMGMGFYCIFHNNVRVENAMESPNVPGVAPKHLITVWLSPGNDSEITHIINGTGAAARANAREQRTPF